MSWLGAALFSWLQGTSMYSDLHAQAVAKLPIGDGRQWLDVGCGPGLVTRLASASGYEALGIDKDPEMIRFARWQSRHTAHCRFVKGDLSDVAAQTSADVVSAASLLYVVPNPDHMIKEMWNCVRPGGRLLVIETTERMTPLYARAVGRTLPLSDRIALGLWARARNGRSVMPRITATLPDGPSQRSPFLDGLVQACVWTKPQHSNSITRSSL